MENTFKLTYDHYWKSADEANNKEHEFVNFGGIERFLPFF